MAIVIEYRLKKEYQVLFMSVKLITQNLLEDVIIAVTYVSDGADCLRYV